MKFISLIAKEISVGRLRDTYPLTLPITDNEYQKLEDASNVLVALVCVEDGDTFHEAKEGAVVIISMFLKYQSDVRSILIIPFGHLSEIACYNLDAVAIVINKMKRSIVKAGYKVQAVEPHSANIILGRLLLFDKMNSVKLVSSRSSLKQTIAALVRAFGVQKFMAALGDVVSGRGAV